MQAFLLTNFALTGPPLALFIIFTLTVFVFTLLVALIIGLLAAVLFTLFMVGVALVIVFPTIFFTTFAASFLFLWGLGGYYIVKWFNEGEDTVPQGSAIGDKLNDLTGGRLGWMMDSARQEKKTGHKKDPAQEKSQGVPGTDVTKNFNHAANSTANVTNGTGLDSAKKQVDGVTKRTKGTVGTVKGGVGGATGLPTGALPTNALPTG